MPDFGSLPAEMAADLMLSAARSVTTCQVRNAFAGYDDAPDLDTEEAAELVQAVLDVIETAGIDIETGA